MGRVLAAFGLAWIVGVFIGVLLGRSDALDRWFWPWVNVFLNMPALVVIVICYLGLGMTELAAVLAVVINKAPLIAVKCETGSPIRISVRRICASLRVIVGAEAKTGLDPTT